MSFSSRGRQNVDDSRRTPRAWSRPAPVSPVEATRAEADERAVVAAARAGDQGAFAALVEPHRRELQVHCYRMLGSFEDSEDLVQETFLRAWRKRASFEGRSSFRPWLYRIATRASLDTLARRPRVPARDRAARLA